MSEPGPAEVPGTGPRRRFPVGALAVVLMVVGISLLAWGTRTSPADPSASGPGDAGVAVPALTDSSLSAPEPTMAEPQLTLEPRQPPDQPHPSAGEPNRVVVPSLGIDAPVVGIPVVDSVLTPPSDPQTLGWWQDGAAPGDLRGGALVTGHTVSVGGGALDDLEELAVGDTVRVETGEGQIRYDVSDVRIYRKASLAQHAAEVFSQEKPGRLVLITCEDWDGQQYLSNVVVVAQPRYPNR